MEQSKFLCVEANEIGIYEAFATCERLTILLANKPSSKRMVIQIYFCGNIIRTWNLLFAIGCKLVSIQWYKTIFFSKKI
jgi:hypothetical protein